MKPSDYQATMPSDYPAQASDYKICPLKPATIRDMLAIYNLDCDEQTLADLRRCGAVRVQSDGPARIETIYGRCDGPRCAWWDAGRDRCGVLPRT